MYPWITTALIFLYIRKRGEMSKQVLIIDDSPTVCKIVEICLHRAGYEVTYISDGVKAIEWLRSGGRVPDLILVDLCLPKMDGYSVIQYLRTQLGLHQIPFVIMSRRSGILDRLKGKLLGAHDYLVKPFQVEELVGVVQSYLGTAVPEAVFR
jgi:DNA-binding response OmpR family regulator